MKSIKKLKKGCGEIWNNYDGDKQKSCGINKYPAFQEYPKLLCKECKAKLETLKEVLELIDKPWLKHLDDVKFKRGEHTCQLCIFLEELKSKIEGNE